MRVRMCVRCLRKSGAAYWPLLLLEIKDNYKLLYTLTLYSRLVRSAAKFRHCHQTIMSDSDRRRREKKKKKSSNEQTNRNSIAEKSTEQDIDIWCVTLVHQLFECVFFSLLFFGPEFGLTQPTELNSI